MVYAWFIFMLNFTFFKQISIRNSDRSAYSDLNPLDGGQSLYPMSTVVEIKTSMYLCLFFLGSVLGVKQGLLQDAVFIQYDLFGNPVSTDEFRDSARFTQEMATAKIFSNIDNILEFFGWHIEPISFTFHNSVNNRSGHSIYYFFY